jgi:hypothetical protein
MRISLPIRSGHCGKHIKETRKRDIDTFGSADLSFSFSEKTCYRERHCDAVVTE